VGTARPQLRFIRRFTGPFPKPDDLPSLPDHIKGTIRLPILRHEQRLRTYTLTYYVIVMPTVSALGFVGYFVTRNPVISYLAIYIAGIPFAFGIRYLLLRRYADTLVVRRLLVALRFT
jgi:hypothetical protein